jgi:hypothetical protein
MVRHFKLVGKIVGMRLGSDSQPISYVVHNRIPSEPSGPAENAFLLIDIVVRPKRARYISWINLFDIENAARHQQGWLVVDPPLDFRQSVQWLPYGWGDQPLPSVANTHEVISSFTEHRSC